MLSDNEQDGKDFSILGLAPWGFMLLLSEIALAILLLLGFATGKLSFALWGLIQFALIFAAGAWFTRNQGKETGK
jgi:small-conductance mechanosensitive channel